MTNPIPIYIDKHRIVWTRDLPPNGVAMTNEERKRELVEAFEAGGKRLFVTRTETLEVTGRGRSVQSSSPQTAYDYLKAKGIG